MKLFNIANSDIRKRRLLLVRQLCTLCQSAHECLHAGSRGFARRSGGDQRSRQRRRLLFRQTRDFAQSTITLNSITDLTRQSGIVITQPVHRISKSVRLLDAQLHTALPLRHHRACLLCGHVERNSHLCGLLREAEQILLRNAGTGRGCRNLREAVCAHRNHQAHALKLTLHSLKPFRREVGHLGQIRHRVFHLHGRQHRTRDRGLHRRCRCAKPLKSSDTKRHLSCGRAEALHALRICLDLPPRHVDLVAKFFLAFPQRDDARLCRCRRTRNAIEFLLLRLKLYRAALNGILRLLVGDCHLLGRNPDSRHL